MRLRCYLGDGDAIDMVLHFVGERMFFECVRRFCDFTHEHVGALEVFKVVTTEIRIRGWIAADGSLEMASTVTVTTHTSRGASCMTLGSDMDVQFTSAHRSDRGPGKRLLIAVCDA